MELLDPEPWGSVSILPTRFQHQVMLRPWTLTNTLMVISCTKLYDSKAYNSVSILPTMFFSQVKGYYFDLWPWKTIRFFPSSWRSNVSICCQLFLQLTVRSLSCLQNFNTKWCLTFELKKKKKVFLSSGWLSVSSYVILKLMVPSLACQQGFSTMTLKNNKILPLIMVIKLTSCMILWNVSVSILPTNFFF
jgi:hypothetical protein